MSEKTSDLYAKNIPSVSSALEFFFAGNEMKASLTAKVSYFDRLALVLALKANNHFIIDKYYLPSFL